MPKKFIKLFVDGSFIYIPLGYLVWSISTHTGYKEGYAGYFLVTALISILIVTVTTKIFEEHLVRCSLGLGLTLISMWVFWDYMDHPWFAGPETYTCDGPCFGWFSFENDNIGIFILAFIGAPIIFVTGIIKLFIFNFSTIVKKFKLILNRHTS